MIGAWLYHLLGLSGTGPVYAFLSGSGSDVGELAIIGGLITQARNANCEVHGCWRLGRHRTAAGHRVCRVHHPDDHLTAERVRAEHEEARP